jgi:type II secretory pathway pseudopilin PulG
MDNITKIKGWIEQNVPMLKVVYENKYVGMGYDRFASLPSQQQRNVLLGTFSGLIAIIFLFLLSFYLGYWRSASKAEKAQAMTNLLLQYQKSRRNQDAQIQLLERNNLLNAPDALKNYLLEQGKISNISPRMIKAEEKSEPTGSDEGKGQQDAKAKHATVKLEKINLNQLKAFLQSIENGSYNLIISSLKISNDDKIRGYMNVELGIVAYLFGTEEEG